MKQTMTTLFVIALLITPTAFANHHEQIKGHGHDMHDSKETGHDKGMKNMFLVKKEIDGYKVSFHAMKAAEGISHGGSHNLMVKVERGGTTLTDIVANSKVIHPNGKEESKMLIKMGDWYMSGYDLDHKGIHKLMVLFKTTDGKKHFGGVYYPEAKSDR